MRRRLLIQAWGLALCLTFGLMGTGPAEALSSSCLPGPFPATPQAPTFGLDLTSVFGDAHAHLDLWRQPCTDGSGEAVALARITPISTNPSLCEFDLVIL